VRQRVGDGQQQAVRRGQGRRQPARGHQAGEHIGQTGDLGHGQHQDVAADVQLAQLQDAIVVDVADRQQARVHPAPVGDPGRQGVEAGAHHMGEDLVLDQHGQRRRGHVEQHDEEQRPAHRLARLPHRGRGVEAHQDVRQPGRAHHQAEHQGQEVAARDVVAGLLGRRAVGVAVELGRVLGHAAQRRAGQQVVPLGPPLAHGLRRGGRQLGQRALGRLDLVLRRAVALERLHLAPGLVAVGLQAVPAWAILYSSTRAWSRSRRITSCSPGSALSRASAWLTAGS
jgi:hypothetical protein